MRRKRRKTKNYKSWIWLCGIVGICLISFIIVSLNASPYALSNAPKQPFRPYTPEFISTKYYPPVLKSLIVHPQSKSNYFDFILDLGNGESASVKDRKPIAKELIKYFFLGITLPSSDFWVNLNPTEPESTTSYHLALTDIGKVLLDADLKLKQDAARYTDPRTELGKAYWSKLKQQLIAENLPTNQIPTGTRLWIVPGKIVVEEEGDAITIVSAKLKVCLESEYLQDKSDIILASARDTTTQKIQKCNARVFKEILLPAIEHDVNYGQSYAQLRQVYNSLILAACYKQKYWGKGGIYSRCVNQAYLDGLHSEAPWSKNKFFQAYLTSFQKGEYSFYQQEYDPSALDTINRHYFYGGIALALDEAVRDALKQSASPAAGQEEIVTSDVVVTGPLVITDNFQDTILAKVHNGDSRNEPWNREGVQLLEEVDSASLALAQGKQETLTPQEPTVAASPMGGVDFTEVASSAVSATLLRAAEIKELEFYRRQGWQGTLAELRNSDDVKEYFQAIDSTQITDFGMLYAYMWHSYKGPGDIKGSYKIYGVGEVISIIESCLIDESKISDITRAHAGDTSWEWLRPTVIRLLAVRKSEILAPGEIIPLTVIEGIKENGVEKYEFWVRAGHIRYWFEFLKNGIMRITPTQDPYVKIKLSLNAPRNYRPEDFLRKPTRVGIQGDEYRDPRTNASIVIYRGTKFGTMDDPGLQAGSEDNPGHFYIIVTKNNKGQYVIKGRANAEIVFEYKRNSALSVKEEKSRLFQRIGILEKRGDGIFMLHPKWLPRDHPNFKDEKDDVSTKLQINNEEEALKKGESIWLKHNLTKEEQELLDQWMTNEKVTKLEDESGIHYYVWRRSDNGYKSGPPNEYSIYKIRTVYEDADAQWGVTSLVANKINGVITKARRNSLKDILDAVLTDAITEALGWKETLSEIFRTIRTEEKMTRRIQYIEDFNTLLQSYSQEERERIINDLNQLASSNGLKRQLKKKDISEAEWKVIDKILERIEETAKSVSSPATAEEQLVSSGVKVKVVNIEKIAGKIFAAIEGARVLGLRRDRLDSLIADAIMAELDWGNNPNLPELPDKDKVYIVTNEILLASDAAAQIRYINEFKELLGSYPQEERERIINDLNQLASSNGLKSQLKKEDISKAEWKVIDKILERIEETAKSVSSPATAEEQLVSSEIKGEQKADSSAPIVPDRGSFNPEESASSPFQGESKELGGIDFGAIEVEVIQK